MQLLSLIILTLLLIVGSSKCTVTATEQVPRIIFNGPGNCTATEHAMIDKIFEVPARRLLLRSDLISSRELQISNSYPTMCSKICLGYVRGKCRSSTYPACNGYRRLQETSCTTQLNTYQDKLDILRHNVSASCRTFIGDRNSRNSECVDKITYGEIVGARLWRWRPVNSTFSTFQIVQERLPASGYPLCRSHTIAIEAVNDPCVKEARMQFVYPNGTQYAERTETKIPYTVFGDFNGKLIGLPLSLVGTGTYILKITPDQDTLRTKQWMFNVTNC